MYLVGLFALRLSYFGVPSRLSTVGTRAGREVYCGELLPVISIV